MVLVDAVMTVRELIDRLSELPDYYDVCIEVLGEDCEWSAYVEGVERGTGYAVVVVR